MFLGRVGQFLGLQLLQGADNAETRVARFYNIIDIQPGTAPDFLVL